MVSVFRARTIIMSYICTRINVFCAHTHSKMKDLLNFVLLDHPQEVLLGMLVTAAVVFLCLYFVKAGYGMFRTKQWGLSINNKLAWVLMEAPAFVMMLAVWAASDSASRMLPAALVLFGLFELHYAQRSFVFPLLMKGKSRMPIAIMLMGVVFNTINALLIGAYTFNGANPLYAELGSGYLLQWNFLLGVVIFFVGMAINWHSDHVIRHLRKPGDTKHYLPAKGMYRYVTSGNYFGELVEWTGFAIAAAHPAGWIFVIWTAANLVPRAHAIHKRYRQEFGEAVGSRKRIIPFVY